jgi:two-component system chemotaxis response regulator CheB
MANRYEIRLLIIDDSAYNRQTIAEFFNDYPHVKIIGKARDGQEGLQLALTEQPDVITLDLEMPRLDGFGFLRLLMANKPTSVIVISSHSKQDTILRSLELGALDFISKPASKKLFDIKEIKEDVILKVIQAGIYNTSALSRLSSIAPSTGLYHMPLVKKKVPGALANAKKLVVIGASTGGPASISQILKELPAGLNAAIVIVQHMPPVFTSTFADRLNKISSLAVSEVKHFETAKNGHVYVAPGDRDLEIIKSSSDGSYGIIPVMPDGKYQYTPSVDRLFKTAAKSVGSALLGVVLTGMGNDGSCGAQAINDNKGRLLVESEETAVVNGMPLSVIETGIPVTKTALNFVASKIIRFAD